MTEILRIDASARQKRSLSRALADEFFATWRACSRQDRITIRDVGQSPPPPISENWIAAAFSREDDDNAQAALALSDDLIDEVSRADIIVIATPMYNYGMPSALKAWFDQVIRVNRTFTFDLDRGDHPLEPILGGKTLVILSVSGEFGFGQGGVNEIANHLVPHIATCSKYLGVENIHHVGIEYQEFGDARHRASVKAAHAAARDLAGTLQDQPAIEGQAE